MNIAQMLVDFFLSALGLTIFVGEKLRVRLGKLELGKGSDNTGKRKYNLWELVSDGSNYVNVCNGGVSSIFGIVHDRFRATYILSPN